MSVLIVHDPLTAKLAAAESPLEVCTPEGRLLGYFTPAKARQLNLDPGISEEEMTRRESAGGGRPLADILRDLEGEGQATVHAILSRRYNSGVTDTAAKHDEHQP